MMPENLLNELEQAAKDAGVRVALIAAYHQGRAEELKARAESLKRIAIAMQVEQAGSKFTPLAYNADWVEREGD